MIGGVANRRECSEILIDAKAMLQRLLPPPKMKGEL